MVLAGCLAGFEFGGDFEEGAFDIGEFAATGRHFQVEIFDT